MKAVIFRNFIFVGFLAFFLFLTISPAQAEGKSTSTPEIVIPVVDETVTTTPEIVLPETTPVDTPATSTPAISVNLNIRYQDALIFSGAISTTPKDSLLDSAGASHPVNVSSTVLSALIDAASATSTFFVSGLDYYDAYKSFYLNCLTLATTSTPVCGNWNYIVNGIYPSIGMDSFGLSGGENIYLYFSNPWQVTASTSTFSVGVTTTLNTWRYDFDNLTEEWAPDGSDSIDISVINPNSSGWWDTTITTTTLTSDSFGKADFSFSSTGTYFAKITSVDYSKWSLAITLTVLDAPVIATGTTKNGNDESTGNNSGGGDNTQQTTSIISASDIATKVQQILNFLKSQQSNDGKIIDGGVTDWAIISFAASGEYVEDIKKGEKSLLDFARAYDFSDASDLNICASYPRHILALLAGGVSLSDEKIQSLVAKIKDQECYQNHLFGQNGINDDVFALLSLVAVKTDISEPIVSDIIESILKDQTADGAFTWAGYASPDITGAAVNALKYASQKGASIDPTIFSKAKNYLKAQQLSDGGWGFGQSDALTTAWAMMGLNALPEKQGDWVSAGDKNPWSVLTSQLNSSGIYESVWAPGTVDWFAEKHAVPALLGKSWPIILQPRKQTMDMPVLASGGAGADNVIETSTSTPVSTSTVPLILESNTSTLFIATSTVANLPIEDASKVSILPPSIKISNQPQPKVEKSQKLIPSMEKRETLKDVTIATSPSVADQPVDPILPLEKKVAETAAAGSAIILSASTLLLLSRLLLAIL